jgi:predicted nucleotidyltransferase
MAVQLNENQREAISRYLSILKKRYKGQISEVILYGSVARGESIAESDIDLLIVTANGDQELRDEISLAGYDIILLTDVILSPLVMDLQTYEWHKEYGDPFYNSVQRDGIDLWMNKPEFL